jgi:O-antigen ligase
MPILSSVLNQNIISSLSTSIGFLGEPQADRTGSWRLIAWQQELDSALKHPLFGEPFGGYSHWYDGHQWLRVHVHNGYIMYFSKLGLLGLSLFLIAVFLWYVDLWRFSIVTTDPHLKLMAYAFQIILGMFLVFSMFYNFNAYFWVIFAAGTLLVKQNNRKIKLVYSDRMRL